MEFVKKFGLDYCDLPTILWNVDILLQTLTVNIIRRYNKPIHWIYYIINIITGICYIYVYIFSTIWFAVVKCRETGDFISAMVALSLMTCSITCFPKLFYMKYYSNTVMDLVDAYLHCNELVVKGTRFEKNFLVNMRTVKKQAAIGWGVLFINGVVYIILPYVRPGRHFTQDLFILYGLEPMKESPNYETASALLSLAVYFSLTVMVHITLFIIIMIGFLVAQMLALTTELTHIWEDSEKFYNYCIRHKNEVIAKDVARNIFLKNRLRDILKLQVEVINLRNKVERELRFIFVNDFLFMIFALVTELVGGLENTLIQLPFTIGMVFIDCYIGQRLIDASTAFENAVYSCKWENFDVPNQKTVLFMLQCSQKTMTLTAGGIAILDYPYLMFVFKSTYSAYTTLQTSA